MTINLHFHIEHLHVSSNDDTLLKKIIEDTTFIKQQNQKIMALNEQQFTELFGRIDTATTRIADRIRALEEAVKKEGLPADAEERILAKATGIADALDQIGKDPETPTPEIPENPETPLTPQ
jgi:hypothetical protein